METIERFADLVVRAGANVQPGQGVVLRSDTAHLETARVVAEAAYAARGSWVEPVFSDGPLRRSAVRHAGIETLSASRGWALARIEEWRRQGWASIMLAGDPDPHLFDGLDPARVAAQPVEEAQALRRAVFGGRRRA